MIYTQTPSVYVPPLMLNSKCYSEHEYNLVLCDLANCDASTVKLISHQIKCTAYWMEMEAVMAHFKAKYEYSPKGLRFFTSHDNQVRERDSSCVLLE
jgi:hypothetical protein